MTGLKPCKKCNSEDVDLIAIPFKKSRFHRYFFFCNCCGYTEYGGYNGEKAIEIWNRRIVENE